MNNSMTENNTSPSPRYLPYSPELCMKVLKIRPWRFIDGAAPEDYVYDTLNEHWIINKQITGVIETKPIANKKH